MTLEKRTVLAREIMSSPVITINGEAPVSEAARVMLERNIGSLPVVDSDGKYLGMITENMLMPAEEGVPFMRGTILRLLGEAVGDVDMIEETIVSVRDKPVSEAADKHFPSAKPDTHMGEITDALVTRDRNHVVILDDHRPVGIVSRHDLLRAYLDG